MGQVLQIMAISIICLMKWMYMIEKLFKHGIINLEYRTINNYQAYMAFYLVKYGRL